MSFEYEVVVRTRKHKREKIRGLAATLAKSHEGTLLDENEEDEDADDDSFDLSFTFAKGGGTIEVTRLLRGYRVYLDSQRDGNRDAWEDIGGLANDLAAKIGTIVDDKAVASEMIEESEEDGEPVEAVARVRVETRDGAQIDDELALPEGILLAAIDGAGMLRDIVGQPVLTEEGRYTKRVGRIVATLHDTSGRAYRRHRWSCDGYGRIIRAAVDELD